MVECKYKDHCSGCQYLGIPYEEQQNLKKLHLQDLLYEAQIPLIQPPQFLSAGEAHLRDRADLVYDFGKLGLYERNSRKILDIDECRQFSQALTSFYHEVREIRWPIQKGSLRLRVGPEGQKGLWLDFANVDIKKILDEKVWLEELQRKYFVEIGQKRKVPVLVDGIYKLRDPSPQVWFRTWNEENPVDLSCSVGSFTQPGLRPNRLLTATIAGWLDQTRAQSVLEFGSGIGNLSFPALGSNRRLTACEIDEAALMGFQKSLAGQPRSVQDRVRILQGDFQNKNPQDFEKFDAVLANPPRSGLKEFLSPLVQATHKPAVFIYMSCFAESFVEDGKRLRDAGYKIDDLKIVDQFPQTAHYEILALWTLTSAKIG